MKKVLYSMIFLIVIINSYADQSKKSIQEWTGYTQYINVEDMRGQEFRVSVNTKAENFNSSSAAGLWVRTDIYIEKKDNYKTDFFKNLDKTTILSNKWEKSEITGTIGEEVNLLYFGAISSNNGDFYFDDFKLEIKNNKGIWNNIKINNSSFEDYIFEKDLWFEGVRKKSAIWDAKYFNIEYTDSEYFSGKKSLHISGKNIIGSNENGKYVTVNNIKFYYEIYGEGEPILFLHGNGQTMKGFIQQRDDFLPNYKLIFVDSRGRGKSTFDENVEMTYTLQALDMKLFLDALDIDSANILGWSDGGIIGLIMAMKYPNKVKKLIAMGANIFPEGVVDKDLERIKKVLENRRKKEEKTNADKLLIAKYNLLANYPKLKYDDLSIIKSKTLIMAGDHDDIKGIHTLKMFESIPGAQLAIVPKASHWLPLNQPDRFNKIVLRFLGK